MSISKRFIGILVLALVLGVVVFFLRGDEDSWTCRNGEWIRHGNPLTEKPTELCQNDVNEGIPLLLVNDFHTDRLGGLVCGEGTVTNISNEKIGYVSAIFIFYEFNGSVFDFTTGYVNSEGAMFNPEEEARFKRCIDDEEENIDMTKTKIEFRGKIGDDFDDKEIPFDIKK